MMSKYIYIIAGATIVLYLLYNRLLVVRDPRELYTNLDLIKTSAYTLIIIIMISLVFYNCYKLYKINYPSTNVIQSKYISYFTNAYQHPRNPLLFWTESLISLDIYLKNKTPYYNEQMNYGHYIVTELGKFLRKYQPKSILILVWARITLQGIVCILFMLDVVIYHKFYYFYKYSWILIIPMIISYVIYSITFDTDKHLDSLNDTLTLSIIDRKDIDYSFSLDDPINYNKAIPMSVDQWYEIMKKDIHEQYICYNRLNDAMQAQITLTEQASVLELCVDTMNMFFSFRSYLNNYNKLKERLEIPFNILKYILYTIAWTYILAYAL